jgi:hydrogenase maturation factor HypE
VMTIMAGFYPSRAALRGIVAINRQPAACKPG